MEITRGKINGAQKVTIYGPEGIGKSTFAAQFPNPVFIDTEGSTKHMDVARMPKPSSWTFLLSEVNFIKQHPKLCSTLVIDTADWAEQLCITEICSKSNKAGIEDFGYGKGYTYLAEEFGRLLNLLSELVDKGINVVLVCHAQMRKFEQPDEMGAYDRWELKLQKKVYPLVKEWADMVLFANYKTYVVDVDGQGTGKGTNKAQGGKRVMYTLHHPCWDAKNRHGLADELPFEYAQIAHCFTAPTAPVKENLTTEPAQQQELKFEREPKPMPELITTSKPVIDGNANLPKALADLMYEHEVKVAEIQKVVASRGYYPADTPIEKYDPQFISGVLVGAWEQVYGMIVDIRAQEIKANGEIPFK